MARLFPAVWPWMLALMVWAAWGQAMAADAPSPADVALEKRVMKLSEELRCLVCQNQTIADSNADLAVDLKNQVRDQLRQGKSEDDIIKYMVARYGDFLLYRPPVKITTLMLWFGPPLLLLSGLWLFVRTVLRRRAGKSRPLSAAEQARVRTLLDSAGGDRP